MEHKQTKSETASGNTVSPDPRYAHESVVVNNNKLLVWGGVLFEDGRSKMLSRCECFTMDMYSEQWSQKLAEIDSKQDEPTQCVDARCAVISNTVYSFGGLYSDKGRRVGLNETSSLDCEKMRWKKLEIKGNKPTARSSCGLCAVGEKLVMYGGMISHTDRGKLPDGVQYKQISAFHGSVNDCWEFCPHEVSWTPLVTLGRSPPPRYGHSLTAVTAVRIVLYGGQDPTYLSDMHLLDCQDEVWTWSEVIHSEMWPKGRAYHTTCCVSPSLCVVMGGRVKGGHPDGDAYVVDIERGTAHRISLGDARSRHTACCRVASDGSALIFVFGGTRDSSAFGNSIFDFRVYSWFECCLCLSKVSILLSVSPDPQTPTSISVCDHPTAWLQRDIPDHQLRRRLREITAEKDEAVSQVCHLREEKRTFEREKEELMSPNTQLPGEVERLSLQCETLRAEKDQWNGEKEGLTTQIAQLTTENSLTKHVSEGSRRLHQLCESIHIEESNQLIDEDRQSRYLRLTDLNDFDIKCCLGQSTTSRTGRYGCNSIIYRVEKANAPGVNYVMKAMLNPYDVSDEDVGLGGAAIEDLFKAEYDLPCRPHPNVVRVLHHFCASVPPRGLPQWPPYGGRSSLFLVMKEYDFNLQSHCRNLRQRGSLDERFLLTVLLQLFKAIEHLVRHNILHRDLKLDNVLLKLEPNMTRAVICDFGCSYESPQPLTRANARVLRDTAIGNPAHHSPELSTLSADPNVVCNVSKADVWAAGIMAYEMVTGRNAADFLSHHQKQTRYSADNLPPLHGTCSVHCQRLLQQLVSYSVKHRPSASQAIQLCCIVLYGPTIPSAGEMRVGDAQCWLEQQLVSLRARRDEQLVSNPFYIKYLDLFSPHEVAQLINTFFVR